VGVEPVKLRGLAEAVEDRGDESPALRPRAVVILSSHHWTAESSLGGIVIERNKRIVEKDGQALPTLEDVVD
jgi:hypothetical protein